MTRVEAMRCTANLLYLCPEPKGAVRLDFRAWERVGVELGFISAPEDTGYEWIVDWATMWDAPPEWMERTTLATGRAW